MTTTDIQVGDTTAARTAQLWRHIARTTTDNLPAPIAVRVQPDFDQVDIRLPDNQPSMVDDWARFLDGIPAHDPGTGGIYQVYSTTYGPGGNPTWHGWSVEVWCTVWPEPAGASEPAADVAVSTS